MFLQHWDRPWAWLDPTGTRYVEARDTETELSAQTAGWLCVEDPEAMRVDGRGRGGKGDVDFRVANNRQVIALPLPLRHGRRQAITAGSNGFLLHWDDLPERPADGIVPDNDVQRRAKALLDRVKSVWARIREVEEAMATPAAMWQHLQDIWLNGDEADPEMDLIVRHARELPSVLEYLDRAPRRILRRAPRMLPLARVQEMDRKAMLWLARQPGETIAERAGDRQRIQAIAREEHFNTLENRVLLSYARLARHIAHDYAQRHRRSGSARVQQVHAYDERCRRLERDLVALGIQTASPDVTPNFVLQNNWHYHRIWESWHELLRRHRALDDLWRWQARSWEELSALVTIVAVQSIPGARSVALSPIVFRDEQDRGCWIDHVNPVAVFFLERQKAVLEISYRQFTRSSNLSRFGAAIWLRVGRANRQEDLSRWAVWPLWSADGGLEAGEAHEIGKLLPEGKRDNVRGGITLRPTRQDAAAEIATTGRVSCLTLGTGGQSLADGIVNLRHVIIQHVLGPSD
jgi:hypothetical protein